MNTRFNKTVFSISTIFLAACSSNESNVIPQYTVVNKPTIVTPDHNDIDLGIQYKSHEILPGIELSKKVPMHILSVHRPQPMMEIKHHDEKSGQLSSSMDSSFATNALSNDQSDKMVQTSLDDTEKSSSSKIPATITKNAPNVISESYTFQHQPVDQTDSHVLGDSGSSSIGNSKSIANSHSSQINNTLSKSSCPHEGLTCKDTNLISFQLDSSEISQEQHSLLNLKIIKDRNFEIIGYADTIGDSSHNISLAKNRAQNVKNLLLKLGAQEVHIRETFTSQFEGPEFRKVVILGY